MTGSPTRIICPTTPFTGWKSLLANFIPVSRFFMAISETTTLIVCEIVVPSAAPTGPSPKTPMKR